MGRKRAGGVGETIRTVVYAVLIALVVRTFLFEPFNIPSGSMIPTLLVGDYLFVSKYSYGYSRHSFPFSFPPYSGRVLSGEPERGDVAVFKLPTDNSTDYIKRIVGLPGDSIQVQDGILQINGEAVKRERVAAKAGDAGGSGGIIYVETLPSGISHRIRESGDAEFGDNTPVFEVPAGAYFVMGDNRDNSQDSRFIGPVPAENLVGRAEFLFFSTDGSAALWEVWKWPLAVRWSRLFERVE